MIVCSCKVITDTDIETALLQLLSVDNALIPTPGVVYRHLSKKMDCCGCAPIAVETIYEKMAKLEAQGLICPCACNTARSKLLQLKPAAVHSPALLDHSGVEAEADDNDGVHLLEGV